ncbi:unnamed protein product [Lymnaea stagnalis]|uniref:CTCK domain-containing protein n=1 Tax=Lymnaea stagnalis TaxID=6523 RepID=A0AAV2H510_LYMST
MFVSLGDLTHIWTVVVSLGLLPMVALATESDDCNLLQSTVPITRFATLSHRGNSVGVMCTGDVVLNKCEGTCVSSVSPSVTTYPGYRKDCRCCKETATETKSITLRECYRGSQVVPDLHYTFDVREISGCSCLNCNG